MSAVLEDAKLQQFARWIDAMLEAASDQDPEGLAELAALFDYAADLGLAQAIGRSRQRMGADAYSWADYARVLGITRSAAKAKLDPAVRTARLVNGGESVPTSAAEVARAVLAGERSVPEGPQVREL